MLEPGEGESVASPLDLPWGGGGATVFSSVFGCSGVVTLYTFSV